MAQKLSPFLGQVPAGNKKVLADQELRPEGLDNEVSKRCACADYRGCRDLVEGVLHRIDEL